MEFISRRPGVPARLGILPGSFNPPTRAHLALAEAALAEVDQVVLVLPRAFPHKSYDGASFSQRAEMLRALADRHPRLTAASSDGGLFIEIADECPAAYGADVELAFVCGRDAAERVVGWNYDNPNTINRMLENFQLLVARRDGAYEPSGSLCRHIRALAVAADVNSISSSDVRRRIREGIPWAHLVPDVIVPMVRRFYCAPA